MAATGGVQHPHGGEGGVPGVVLEHDDAVVPRPGHALLHQAVPASRPRLKHSPNEGRYSALSSTYPARHPEEHDQPRGRLFNRGRNVRFQGRTRARLGARGNGSGPKLRQP